MPYLYGIAGGLIFALGWALGYKRAIGDVRDFILRGKRR